MPPFDVSCNSGSSNRATTDSHSRQESGLSANGIIRQDALEIARMATVAALSKVKLRFQNILAAGGYRGGNRIVFLFASSLVRNLETSASRRG